MRQTLRFVLNSSDTLGIFVIRKQKYLNVLDSNLGADSCCHAFIQLRHFSYQYRVSFPVK